MNLRIFSKLEDGVYRVVVHTQDWSEQDRQAIVRYGEPTIDVGGVFVSDDGYTEFTLSSKFGHIMTEAPFAQGFDIRDYADAEARAEVWKAEIANRIQAAVTALRAQADNFTREEVVTV